MGIKFKTNDISYAFQVPAGVPGDVSRPDETNVEQAFLVSPFPANYGLPMQFASGPAGTGVTAIITAAGASGFAGLLVRAAPSISNSSTNESTGIESPNQSEVQGLAVRGYVSVVCAFGTPVRGAAVYVCTTAETGHTVGALEAGSNAYNTILSGEAAVTWAADGKDDFNNAEVRIDS